MDITSPGVTTRQCFAWKTERPSEGILRQSPVFSFLGAEWCLELVLVGMVDGIIHLKKATPWNDFHSFEISTWFESTRPCHYVQLKAETVTSAYQRIWFLDDYDDVDGLAELLSGASFTIVCVIHADSPSGQELEMDQQSNPDALELPADFEGLSFDFGNLMEQNVIPDVELKCGDTIVPAHRAVLAARSQVFATMFRNDMAERRTGVVDVLDVDLQILHLLLRYTYCGQLPSISLNQLTTLYTAADKYAVLGLKKACTDCMTRSLTEENCLDYLVFADAHSDVDFKEEIIRFISKNKQILRSELWSRFETQHSNATLAIEVYHICFTKLFPE